MTAVVLGKHVERAVPDALPVPVDKKSAAHQRQRMLDYWNEWSKR